MRQSKILVLASFSAAAASPASPKACNADSTVYITLPGSPTTETVTVTLHREPSVNEQGSTVYNTVEATEIFSLVHASSAPTSEGDREPYITSLPPTTSAYGAAKAYTRFGSEGWNATTLTTAITASQAAVIQPSAAFLQRPVRDFKARRDVEEWITVTLDGQIVSWVNDYLPVKQTPTPLLAVPPAGDISNNGVTDLLAASPTTESATTASILSTSWTTIASSSPNVRMSPTHWSDPDAASLSTLAPSPGAQDSCKGASPAFIIDFDDLPHFIITDSPDNRDIPPIFNPYRKLYFDSHFGYVPPPSDPYPPHSPPQLAVYRAAGTGADGSAASDGLTISGEVGAGPRAFDDAYWFKPVSAYFGCADGGFAGCRLAIHGLAGADQTRMNVTQTVEVPPCPVFENCKLQYVEFDRSFHGVSGLQMSAAVGDFAVDYYMDDLKLEWYNNTCAAQSLRASAE